MSELDKLKSSLCNTMRELYAEKILTDIVGNLSIRDPDDAEILWITPSGMQKNLVQPHHLIKLSLHGEVLEDPTGMGPSVESPMHIAIAKADDDIKAIIHSHAPYATGYSVLKEPPHIPLLTAELSYLIPDIIIVPYARSGSEELGNDVAEAILDTGIVILENHGVVTCGESIEKAVHKTRALEEILRLYLIAKQFGGEIRPFSGFDSF